jgi:protease I
MADMARILIPLPARDYDPSEAAIAWKLLAARGHAIGFATPDGRPAQADPRMLDGKGLGVWKGLLRAGANAREAHAAMVQSQAFQQPLLYDDIDDSEIDALLLPGGHAPGMKAYLESPRLQALVASHFAASKPAAAICHGVLLVARSKRTDGKSVLHGRRTTGLTRQQEMTAWLMTAAWLGSYYRTYPTPLQTEVQSLLAKPEDFDVGPPALLRDDLDHLGRGFSLRDGNYLSARWPGDAHAWTLKFAEMLAEGRPQPASAIR